MRFEITGPCDEPWDAMEPREGGRYCRRCETEVIDLSVLSRAQAEQRIRAIRAPTVCVRLAVDPFGDAVFQAPPPSRARHWAAGLVLTSALTASACTEPAPTEAAEEAALAPDPGPPMLPTEATIAMVVEAPGPATGPVPREELEDLEDHDASPTPEQRRLTEEKHRPPRILHTAGMMPVPHFGPNGPVF
ncbi:MAG: hypothetical protein R3B82_27450 [Sandaracinaceae bacterium]